MKANFMKTNKEVPLPEDLEQNQEARNTEQEKEQKPAKWFNGFIIGIIAVVVVFAMIVRYMSNSSEDFYALRKETTWKQADTLLKTGMVQKVTLTNGSTLAVYLDVKDSLQAKSYYKADDEDLKKGKTGVIGNFHKKIMLVCKIPDAVFIKDIVKASDDYHFGFEAVEQKGSEFMSLLPVILIFVMTLVILFRSGGMPGMNFTRSRAKMAEEGEEGMKFITFEDVAGLHGAKEEVQEVVDFLRNPLKYTRLGAKIPKGVLLVGPPGTGKTLLAKAVAGEARAPFFSISGSDFMEMYVGVGASRVRDLFRKAKEKAPCIIFIDEIDAVGRARSSGRSGMSGANDERENTLNQLLTEMDGFGSNSGVILLAATNRADILDPALLRAGRFDRQIYVDLPDISERKEIFMVHTRDLFLGADVSIDFLAKQTPGFSGADIANLCNEAALGAARAIQSVIFKQNFLDAIDRIVSGLEKKNKIMTAEEKKTIAYHEAGHATVSWLLEHASPLVKVTIVPRGQSLGAAWYLPKEKVINTKTQILDELCAIMGGRAAEKIVFNQISTGALSDLEKINQRAKEMVIVYGLSDKIGNVSYYDSRGNNEYFAKPYSEHTARIIDEEISLIVESAYTRAIQILTENREKLSELAELLLEKEVIFREDLEKIFGKRTWDVEEIEETPQQATANQEEQSTEQKADNRTFLN
jgi:cell division protease FtsH